MVAAAGGAAEGRERQETLTVCAGRRAVELAGSAGREAAGHALGVGAEGGGLDGRDEEGEEGEEDAGVLHLGQQNVERWE